MHENFSFYLKNYTPVIETTLPTGEEAAKIDTWVPPSLAEFYRERGYLRFHGGLFNLCNPEDFRSILALIFRADRDFHHNECHVVGYSAFGVLQCWSEKLANFEIDLPEASIYSRALTTRDWKPKATRDHLATGMVPDREAADFLDVEGEPMFDRCVERYDSPEVGECFGFVPALALAGTYGPRRTVDHIKRLSALEHFTILAQLEQFSLMVATADDLVPVRSIG